MKNNVTVDKKNLLILYKGKQLCTGDLVSIHHNFDVMCTAEFIGENYSHISDEQIWDLAEEVRDLMDDKDYTESDAIYYVLKKHNFQERSNT